MSGDDAGDLTVATLLADAGSSAEDARQVGATVALLLDSCAATAALTPQGWQVLRGTLVHHLRNRVRIRRYVQARPDTTQRSLGAPVVITGVPRTGTSLLHNLLAQDCGHRTLRVWEARRPVPPDPQRGPDEASLVDGARRWLERLYTRIPQFPAIHPLTATGPEECDVLLQNSVASQHFEDMFDARDYSAWLRDSTLLEPYGYYARQLKVLSGDLAGRRWLLKSPGHIGHLDALFHVLPAARVIHCHRDPTVSVPSYASLIRAVRAPNTRAMSLSTLGEQALQRCVDDLGRALQVRADDGEDRVLDVGYPALVRDPIGTVARVYAWLDRPLPAPAATAMRDWLDAHPRDRHGAHRYDPHAFGLPAGRVRARLGGYLDRFASIVTG